MYDETVVNTGRNAPLLRRMMAYEMDEAIRKATEGLKSLRDLFRRLLEENPHQPIDLDRLPDLCRQATGVDVSAIYRLWLDPSVRVPPET